MSSSTYYYCLRFKILVILTFFFWHTILLLYSKIYIMPTYIVKRMNVEKVRMTSYFETKGVLLILLAIFK
jgi:hypothetical protein